MIKWVDEMILRDGLFADSFVWSGSLAFERGAQLKHLQGVIEKGGYCSVLGPRKENHDIYNFLCMLELVSRTGSLPEAMKRRLKC